MAHGKTRGLLGYSWFGTPSVLQGLCRNFLSSEVVIYQTLADLIGS
jgi:hypothetical protein